MVFGRTDVGGNAEMRAFFFIAIICFGCNSTRDSDGSQTDKQPAEISIQSAKVDLRTDSVMIDCDTIFPKDGFYIKGVLSGPPSAFGSGPNLAFTFGRDKEIIYFDSLYSRVGQFEFADINQDGIKDIMVQNASDVRSNWTYALYIVNLETPSLTKVRGFDEIKNPELLSDIGIIQSYVSSGTNYYQFYQFIENDSVVNLGIDLYDDHTDSSYGAYLQTIEKIKESTTANNRN